MHWFSQFRCKSCLAVITFRDESPSWQASNARVALLEEARAVAEKYQGQVYPGMYLGHEAPQIVKDARPYINFLERRSENGFIAYVITGNLVNTDTRCFACPCCKAEIFLEDAITPSAEEE